MILLEKNEGITITPNSSYGHIPLSPVRTGLKTGKITGQMGILPILSPVWTAQEVFLPGNLPDSNG